MTEIIIQNKLLYPEILWERPVHYYKSKAGKVLILAGSKGEPQAATLAAEAVFRSGTGILTLGFPDRLKDFYKDTLPDSMTLPLPSTLSDSLAKRGHDQIIEVAKSCDVALIGPGLSGNAETVQLIWDLIFDLEIPIVLDGDGIGALATGIEVMRKKESEDFMKDFFKKINECLVVVAGPGGLHRLIKAMAPKDSEKDPLKQLAYVSNITGCLAVFKDDQIALTDGEKIVVDKTNPIGTNTEVLAGIIASFLAQNHKKRFEAIATSIHLNNLASLLAAEEIGDRAVSASDIIRFLPQAIKKAEGGF